MLAQRRRPGEARGQSDVDRHVGDESERSQPPELIVLVVVAALDLRVGHHEQRASAVVLALEGLEAAAEEEDRCHHED